MLGSYEVRPAKPADATAITEVVRAAFSAGFVRLFIFGCRGVSTYLERAIRGDALVGRQRHWVAVSRSDVIAYAELRWTQTEAFLNQIAVCATWRGRGVGRNLFGAALSCAPRTAKTVCLDVLSRNSKAKRWYEHLGFTPCSRVLWTEETVRTDGRDYEVVLDGYPEAEICQSKFGFSQFGVRTPSQRYVVGRLSDKWFRLTSNSAARDPALMFALKQLDPFRRLLLIVEKDEGARIRREQRRLITETRMRGSRQLVARALAE